MLAVRPEQGRRQRGRLHRHPDGGAVKLAIAAALLVLAAEALALIAAAHLAHAVEDALHPLTDDMEME